MAADLEGQTIAVFVSQAEGDVWVGSDVIERGRVNLKLDSNKGDSVPEINSGDSISVNVFSEVTVISGNFQ